MSLIGNPDTPLSYVADYMQACVGMFGIPAGGFVSEIETYGAATNWDVESLYAAMLNSSVGRSIYAPGISNESFATKLVDKLGGSLLSDANKAAAVDEVQALLDGGLSHAATAMAVVEFVAGLETSDETYGAVAQQFQNRIEIANYYTFSTTSPSTSLNTLTSVLSGVTDTTDVSDPAAVIEEQAPGVSGETYTLTTGSDNIIGTTGNDTINGANGTTDTFAIVDVIDGGAGTDTLSLVLDTGGTSLPAASVKNVEVLQVRDTVGATLDVSQISSLTTVVLSGGTADTVLDNVNTTITSVKMDSVKGDLQVNTGNVATLNLTLANVKGDATTGDDVDVDIVEATTAITKLNVTVESDSRLEILNADEVKTASVAATGGTFTVDDWNEAGALETLTVSGSKNVTFSDLTDAAALKTVTSTNTGTLNLDYGTALSNTVTSVTVTGAGAVKVTSGATTTAITGGDGNDTVSVLALDYGAAGVQKIAGGAGTDTINVTASANLDAGFIANVTGFETLSIGGSNGTDGGGTGNGSYDLDGLGFTTVVADADLTKSATVTNITTEAISVTASITTGLALNLKSATGTADALKVTIAGAYSDAGTPTDTTDDANDLTVAELDTDNANVIENLTIESNTGSGNVAGVKNTVTLLDTDATKVIVTGGHALEITGFETGGAVNTTLKTIDASASTGGLIMGDGVGTVNVSIVGSDKADDIVVTDTDGAGDADGDGTGSTINAGKGGDVVTYKDTGASDTYIIEKGDSLLGYTDTDKNGSYTAAGDRETFDILTGFTSGEDTIDLGAFGFTGQKASGLAGATVTEATALKLVKGETTSIADLFVDTGIQRGVAIASVNDYADIGSAASTSTLVFIDSNGDGDFTTADDDVILLSGTASVALADFGF